MPEEKNLFETDRKITMTTLAREVKILDTQKLSDVIKFSNVYKRINMDIIDWMLENSINDWESLRKKLEKKEDDKLTELVKLCAKRRLLSENPILFMEDALRNFKAIANLPDNLLINIILKMTWPTKPGMIEKLMSSQTIADLIERTRLIEENISNEKRIICPICKKKGHKANKCHYKTESQNGI